MYAAAVLFSLFREREAHSFFHARERWMFSQHIKGHSTQSPHPKRVIHSLALKVSVSAGEEAMMAPTTCDRAPKVAESLACTPLFSRKLW